MANGKSELIFRLVIRVRPVRFLRRLSMGYDGKYGKVTTEHRSITDDEPVIVFRARDRLTPKLLRLYRELCERGGSPQRHLDLIDRTGGEFLQWQKDHRDQVRTPDSERSRAWLGDRLSVKDDG
jgi:hypothetical protein